MGNDVSKLQEKYHIQKVKLGEGSFGTVWRAVDKVTDQVVAIKSVEKDRMRKRGVKPDDMAREIKMLFEARGCEYITELRDTFEDDSGHYLALEYCEGGDFGDKLKEKKNSLEEYEAANWMRQILLAIDFLHQKNIVHRDIKPDNFMLSSHGKTAKLKLSDFGLAIRLPNSTFLLKDKCGTPAFMAPEQHELPRSEGYSFPVDVFAAGTCLWCILHGGEHPFMNGTQLDLAALLAGSPQFRGNSAFWASSKWTPAAQAFVNEMTSRNNRERPNTKKALASVWFQHWQSQVEQFVYGGKMGAASPSRPTTGSAPSMPTPVDKIGHTSADTLRARNQELQAKIDEISKREANEKAAMAEKIKLLEQQAAANDGGARSSVLGETPPPLMKRLSGGFAGGLLQGIANAFAGGDEAQGSQPLSRPDPQPYTANDAYVGIPNLQFEFEAQQPGNVGLGGGGEGQGAANLNQPNPGAVQTLLAGGFGGPNSGDNSNKNEALADEQERLKRKQVNTLDAQLQKQREATNSAGSGGSASQAGGKNVHNINQKMLADGMKVCYNSASHDAWFMGQVQGYNPSDGTYNLDLKQHAPADRVSPPFERNPDYAWSPGVFVNYWSESVKQWLKAVILSYNVDDGSYNLDVKQRATVDRIRIRNGIEVLESGAATSSGPGSAEGGLGSDVQQGSAGSGNRGGGSPAKAERYMGYDSLKGAGEVVGRLTNPFGKNIEVMGGNEQRGGSSGSRATEAAPVTRPNNIAPDGGMQYLNWAEAPVKKPSQPELARSSTAGSDIAEAKNFVSLSGVLKPGTFCSFRESDSGSWQPARVEAYVNENALLLCVGVTYPDTPQKLQQDLAIFQQRIERGEPPSSREGTLIRASPVQIGPPRGNYGSPAPAHLRWPMGTWVLYHSVSLDSWLASSIQSYTEAGDQLINLANKPLADPERVRARLRPEAAEKAAIEQQLAAAGAQNQNQAAEGGQMSCEKCGRVYWSLSGRTNLCPPCREANR